MKKAIYPGTFDPVTNGHMDIIKRATGLFDEVIVAIAVENYKNNLFSLEERLELLEEEVKEYDNVTITSFDGLLMEFAEETGSVAVIRGLRAVSDFEYELQLALMNKKLNKNVETMFLMTDSKYSFISSSIIKQVASLQGSVCGLVPKNVEDALKAKYK
ncbi:pantetheine-phosphate adenylyltransferase [Desulfitispora alkaliphila]|uniref:pantetheine-phosphate adenylyltransferase n=1 Tax=Desulfitispora alkaliphila TaxID=622674 RepID=UPI003D21E0FC